MPAHDLLDKDLPCPPVLLTVNHGGKKIDAVAQGTKHGLLFVFNRVTGEPLWPIEESPVPQTELVGEQAWPTQPFPTKPPPLMRQRYTQDDASDISPETHRLTLDRIQAALNFSLRSSHGVRHLRTFALIRICDGASGMISSNSKLRSCVGRGDCYIDARPSPVKFFLRGSLP